MKFSQRGTCLEIKVGKQFMLHFDAIGSTPCVTFGFLESEKVYEPISVYTGGART